jgi:D-alanine transaminase
MLVWINGEITSPKDAKVSVFDRGFLYGDAVYELVRFFDGVGIGMDLHVMRLSRSLELTGIDGFDAHDFPSICDELLTELGDSNATVYLQVTRGVQIPRQHAPDPAQRPTVVAIVAHADPLDGIDHPESTPVAIVPDDRRRSCNIKATSLLENVLATIKASECGATEPLLHIDGVLTEGGSSNVFVVKDGAIWTPSLDTPRLILAGVMRALVIEAAEGAGISVTEGTTTVEALRNAEEAFLTSSRRLLAAITSIDGDPLQPEEPGPVTLQVFAEMRGRLEAQVAAAVSS